MHSPDRRAAAPHPIAPAVKLSPSTGSPMRLVEGEPTSYTFRKVALTASGPIWECPDTKQRYSTPEQVNAVLAQVHRLWREHLGIGRVALREHRLALGLSAAQASALLGFGINQYSTYEQTDKLPSQSNAVLLQQFISDKGIAALLEGEAARQALKPAARRRLQQYVAALAPAITLSRPAITATGSDVAGGSVGSLSEIPLRNQVPEQAQALQESLMKFHSIALQANDYSYAMAA
jgi:transcriptional regulator with XRE-family HTH domain